MWYKLKRFVRNVYLWRKILWAWDVYDYNYSLDVLKFSLQELGKHLISHNCVVGAPKSAKEIQIAVGYIDLIQREGDNPLQRVKLNELIPDGLDFSEHGMNLYRLTHKVLWDSYPLSMCSYKEDWNLEQQRVKEAWDALFKLFKRKMHRWWD